MEKLIMKNMVKQIIFFAVLVALMVGSWWVFDSLRMWAWMWSVIAFVVITTEVIAKIKTGKTISEQFWAFRNKNLTGAWLMVISMIASVLLLGWHLMSGAYTNKKKG